MLQNILAGCIVLCAALSGTGVLCYVLAQDEENKPLLSKRCMRRILQRGGWVVLGLVVVASVFCSALGITAVDIEFAAGITLLFFSLRYLSVNNLSSISCNENNKEKKECLRSLNISKVVVILTIIFLASSNGAVTTLLSVALAMGIFYLLHKRSSIVNLKIGVEKIKIFSDIANILFCLYSGHLIREALQGI